MFYVKVVDLLTTYQMPFAVCRSDVFFFISEGGPKRPPLRLESNLSEPARNSVNDLTTRTKNDILFFADDTSLYASHTSKTFTATQSSLQLDLDEIKKYGQEWANSTIQKLFNKHSLTSHTTHSLRSVDFQYLQRKHTATLV